MKEEQNRRGWQRDWTWEGLSVLRVSCTLPRFSEDTPAGRRMERYWRHWERCLLRWLTRYHVICCDRARAALERSRPIPMETVTVETRELYRGEGLLSLLVSVRTPHGTRRFPELWRLGDGTPADVSRLLPLWRRPGRQAMLTRAGILVTDRTGQARLVVAREKIRGKLERLAG